MYNFDNYSTESVICPYCGEEHETDESFFFDEDFTEFDCYGCGRRFAVKTNVIWSWETAQIDETNVIDEQLDQFNDEFMEA